MAAILRISTMLLQSNWRGRRGCAAVLRMGVLVLAGLVCVAAAYAQPKQRKQPAPPAGLPGRINALANQLQGVPLDESDPLTGQIQSLVLAHIQQWLAERITHDTPSDVEVRRELEQLFAPIHYPVYAWPAVFAQAWKGGMLYGVGYTLGWSDYDRANVIALFEGRQKQLRLNAITHFVPHTDLHYEFMMPPPSGDFWFIVYGTRLGKSQPRLTAMLYSFDGQSLSSIWKILDAYDGRISVGQNWLTIRYLKEDEYVRETQRGRKPPRYESTYKATLQGLELVSTGEIPF
jgi:hypothetical protein